MPRYRRASAVINISLSNVRTSIAYVAPTRHSCNIIKTPSASKASVCSVIVPLPVFVLEFALVCVFLFGVCVCLLVLRYGFSCGFITIRVLTYLRTRRTIFMFNMSISNFEDEQTRFSQEIGTDKCLVFDVSCSPHQENRRLPLEHFSSDSAYMRTCHVVTGEHVLGGCTCEALDAAEFFFLADAWNKPQIPRLRAILPCAPMRWRRRFHDSMATSVSLT